MVYFGTEALTGNWKHYDLTLPVDRAIPLVPGATVIYLGCYIFWIINYILIARQGEEHCFRFVTADMLSRIVSGIIFILLPTTNVRPVLAGDDIFVKLLGMIYSIDEPTRLFPSIHCLVSWFCYIGIRGRENIPKAYRAFSCIFALLGLRLYAVDEAALYHRCVWRNCHSRTDLLAGIPYAGLPRPEAGIRLAVQGNL